MHQVKPEGPLDEDRLKTVHYAKPGKPVAHLVSKALDTRIECSFPLLSHFLRIRFGRLVLGYSPVLLKLELCVLLVDVVSNSIQLNPLQQVIAQFDQSQPLTQTEKESLVLLGLVNERQVLLEVGGHVIVVVVFDLLQVESHDLFVNNFIE
jgi:hypothetical protein